MGCEMDRLLNDFFQCGKSAYTPHQFLYNMWRSSQHLAGYLLPSAAFPCLSSSLPLCPPATSVSLLHILLLVLDMLAT